MMADKKKSPETQSKKKQFFIFGLCSFLALALCMLTLVIVVKNVEKNENTQVEAESEVADDKEDNKDNNKGYFRHRHLPFCLP